MVHGMTFCSLSGLVGGRAGAFAGERKPLWKDPTLWAAGLFGVLPDAASLAIPMLLHIGDGIRSFFQEVGEDTLIVYRIFHNLFLPAMVSLLFWRFRRRWFWASLAWPLHIVTDAFCHGPGKFQTLLFYPLTHWGFPGINWWEHPWMFWTSWVILPPIWMWIHWRRRQNRILRLREQD